MLDVTLLLTGTVNSSGVSLMKRNETEIRLNDYKRAIEKWLEIDTLKIVFVENSNFNFENFNFLRKNLTNFEYLTYDGQNFSRNKGKGYGEINSFEFAFKNSTILKNSDFIIKCNGRYYFEGINNFKIANYGVIGNISSNLKYMDSRVFGFKKDFFYNYFLQYKDVIDDSKKIYFENALASATLKFIADGGNWCRVQFPLIIKGYSGSNNYKYDTFKSVLLIKIRFFIRKLLKFN